MAKIFNVTGTCMPDRHYMVDLTSRLEAIRKMVDAGDYFMINRGRQYGKTTTLAALAAYLKPEYDVISLDFQGISTADFETEQRFVAAFSRQMMFAARMLPSAVRTELGTYATGKDRDATLSVLFMTLLRACEENEKKIVLLIDLESPPRLSSAADRATHSENASRLGGAEVDSASNNQVFLDFLAQLRFYYLNRNIYPTFQSVILAGVHDIRSIKRKIRPERPSNAQRFFNDGRDLPPTDREGAFPLEEEHKVNSPWNIASDFEVDMNFSVNDISGMLNQYEEDYHTGMDVKELSELIFTYTSGYPVLVSRICKLLDERISGSAEFPDKKSAWTREGFGEALKKVTKENNPLYDSLLGKLQTYPELKAFLQELLFTGSARSYVPTASYIKDAAMFGFIRNDNDTVAIANRIFETVLYETFMAEEFADSKFYAVGTQERNQFIIGGHLDMRRILEKFIETFDELYGEEDEEFLEKVGRKYFLLFLKPIINGVGNYSIEPQTRNSERMDVVIYYRGEQNILELKIWRGNAYNERGEKQLSGYLDYFHMKKGYMLSFNFNKTKTRGIKEIALGDKTLIEAVV